MRAVYIGNYDAGETGYIRVELTLIRIWYWKKIQALLREKERAAWSTTTQGYFPRSTGSLWSLRLRPKAEMETMAAEAEATAEEAAEAEAEPRIDADNETPLSPPLTDETILDEPVPLAVLPKTGDETPIIPAVVTLLGSGIILLWLGSSLRKKKETESPS